MDEMVGKTVQAPIFGFLYGTHDTFLENSAWPLGGGRSVRSRFLANTPFCGGLRLGTLPPEVGWLRKALVGVVMMEMVGLIVKVLSFQNTWMLDRVAPPPRRAGINSPDTLPTGSIITFRFQELSDAGHPRFPRTGLDQRLEVLYRFFSPPQFFFHRTCFTEMFHKSYNLFEFYLSCVFFIHSKPPTGRHKAPNNRIPK